MREVVEDDDGRRVERLVFRGAQGLRDFPVEGRFSSSDPDSFEAEMTRVRLGPLVIRRTRVSPHRALVDGRGGVDEPEILRLMTVQAGSLLVAAPGERPIRLVAGDALFTARDRPYAYRSDGPVVIVSSTLPVSSLPGSVQRLDRLPVGALPHSALVDAVLGLMADLSRRIDDGWTFDSGFAARGLIDLESAILTELIGPREPLAGPDRVYRAAIEYIERHLGDPELRPPQIADALGVSLRYLHRAFDDREATVARHLRERRLDLVAAELRAATRPPPFAALAERYGFTSQERLARAFRSRYAMSMTEYRAQG